MSRAFGRRGGFTLIELLVVVAVLAVLIAVLLPALASTQERARGAMSMANQRSLAVALNAYADDHGDLIPLGHSLGPGPDGWKQYNYLLRSGSSSGEAAMRWMGLLYEHGAFESPQAFYSPSETDDLLSFDTEDNPWPPDDTAPAGKSTRIGYGVRPLAAWPFPRERALPVAEMPRRSDLGRRGPEVILADLIHKPQRVEQRHGDRVHVMRSDASGGVVMVDVLTSYERPEDAPAVSVTWEDTRGSSFDAGFNDLFLTVDERGRGVAGLWLALDRGSR